MNFVTVVLILFAILGALLVVRMSIEFFIMLQTHRELERCPRCGKPKCPVCHPICVVDKR